MSTTRYLDPDNRRLPKSERYCVRCHKDIRPGSPALPVIVDYNNITAELSTIQTSTGLIGLDCAIVIGLTGIKTPAPAGNRRAGNEHNNGQIFGNLPGV
jgi:hypothetical protein